MAISGNVYKGQVFGLYIVDNSNNEVKIGQTRSKEFSESKELLDRSSDDNADYQSYIGAIKEGEVTFDALYDYDDQGFSLLTAAYKSDTPSTFVLKGANSGEPKVDFDAHVSERTRTHNYNELSVYNVTLALDGEWTEGTVA